jgi:cysteine synthase A
VQGWAPDFIPRLAEDARSFVHEIVPVSGSKALSTARDLAAKEGILTGISGGATMAGALAVAAGSKPGTRVLCMLPDTGERYLSTPLFDDIAVHMTEEELAISQSTPSSRFDKEPAVPPADPEHVEVTHEARAFVRDTIESEQQPVVIFALEWCEFTWSVRKLFARCQIAYKAVDIDSVAYQTDNWGGKIRAALTERTGLPTIPQVFVAGTLIGGARDTFNAFEQGRLQRVLASSHVAFRDLGEESLWDLWPTWAQR